MSIVGFEQEATTVRTTILRKRTRECEPTSSLCFIILPAPAIFTFHVFFSPLRFLDDSFNSLGSVSGNCPLLVL